MDVEKNRENNTILVDPFPGETIFFHIYASLAGLGTPNKMLNMKSILGKITHRADG
jgi:hypothetical protein